MDRHERRGAARVVAATAAWAAAHSLLASVPAKATATRLLGTRNRNGLYRAGYNAFAVATFLLLIRFIRRQPHRVFYRIPGPGAAAMRLARLASLLYCVWGLFQVGLGGMSGLPHLFAWFAGRRHVPREPEGQTPPPHAPMSEAEVRRTGPFGLTRQALNFFLVPLLWLTPRMTSRLAAFNAVATAYLYLGSLHSDDRLRRFYGPAYDDAYRQRGVPLFLPRLGSTRARTPRKTFLQLV